MTIGQFNELLMQRDELKQEIKRNIEKLPPQVAEALQVPGAIEVALMMKQFNDLCFAITDAEKSIQSQSK